MSIRCGHCHQRHDTVDEVRICSAERTDGQPQLNSLDPPEQPEASTPTEATKRKKKRPTIRIESYQPPPKLTIEDLEQARSPERSARPPRRKRARTRRRSSGGGGGGFYGFGPQRPNDADIHRRIGPTQDYDDDT